MRKLVVLKLDGDLSLGVKVVLEISEENQRPFTETNASLPPNQNIVTAIEEWRETSGSLWKYTRVKAKKITIDGSISKRRQDCSKCVSILKEELNNWLCSESFRPIREKWLKHLIPSDEIRVMIRTNQMQLRKLPWHLWDLVDKDYPKAEITLSLPQLERSEAIKTSFHRDKLKILAILGDSEDINLEKDRELLKSLPLSTTTFLAQPKRQDINDKLWNQHWNILFFAGHSKTIGDTGKIHINEEDSLTVTELRYALRNAVKNNLQLAIFNSCDGLGLACELQDLQIPQIIVMREPVPDKVAQEFLKYFLVAFSGGLSIYMSVRTAREKLQGLEDEYPGASWLPMICEHPSVIPLTWKSSKVSYTNCIGKILFSSLLITASVLGIRHQGLLQTWELQAYDTMMRQRPSENQDSRLLIVQVTENDLQLPEQQQRTGSLSDVALNKLLEKISQLKPRTIGLDIYLNSTSLNSELIRKLKNTDNLFAICKVKDETQNHPGTSPPKEISSDLLGFSDIVEDTDNVLRRHLISMTSDPASECVAHSAFSTQLAAHYFDKEEIETKYNSEKKFKIGNVVFERLHPHMGGYHKIDAQGYQILLNYRTYKNSPLKIAPKVTLSDVFKGKLKPEEVEDKIVIIGTTAQTFQDYKSTPYSTQSDFYQKMPGVIVQAQMVSQLVSAVKDGRALMSVLPVWVEILWIWSWGLVGGVIAWRFSKGIYLVLRMGGAVIILYAASSLIFSYQALWVALIPSGLALMLTGSAIAIYRFFPQIEN